jgi:hypothetical protein
MPPVIVRPNPQVGAGASSRELQPGTSAGHSCRDKGRGAGAGVLFVFLKCNRCLRLHVLACMRRVCVCADN